MEKEIVEVPFVAHESAMNRIYTNIYFILENYRKAISLLLKLTKTRYVL